VWPVLGGIVWFKHNQANKGRGGTGADREKWRRWTSPGFAGFGPPSGEVKPTNLTKPIYYPAGQGWAKIH